jgi:hypothetical protein
MAESSSYFAEAFGLNMTSEIWGFHGCEDDDVVLLDFDIT